MSLFDQRQSEDELRSEIARLRGHLALFQKDGARLDFLERRVSALHRAPGGIWCVDFDRRNFPLGVRGSIRNALDAADEESRK